MRAVEVMRLLYGLVIVIVLAVLAGVIALGHVEEKTSFGLMPIITALSALAGAFGQWAFGPVPPPPPPPPSERDRISDGS